MLHKTKIGVCMDNTVAYLLEQKNHERVITIIEANEDEDLDLDHTPAQPTRKDHKFFKKVFEMIKDFDKVSLFGPAAAKRELLNRIRANKLFHIEIQNNPIEDNVTENQKIEFINEYFST